MMTERRLRYVGFSIETMHKEIHIELGVKYFANRVSFHRSLARSVA